jgi:hypothetical protein
MTEPPADPLTPMHQPPQNPSRNAHQPLPADTAPHFVRPDHGLFPPLGPHDRQRLAAESMDLGVGFLNVNDLDSAISWFHHAATWDYPGAAAAREAAVALRDSLAAAEIDHLTGEDTPHADGLGQATQAVADALVNAAELAARAAAAAAPAPGATSMTDQPPPPSPRRGSPTFTSRLPQRADEFDTWHSITEHMTTVIGAFEELRTRTAENTLGSHVIALRLRHIATALGLIDKAMASFRALFREDEADHMWTMAIKRFLLWRQGRDTTVHLRDSHSPTSQISLCGLEFDEESGVRLEVELDDLDDARHQDELCAGCSMEFTTRAFTPGALPIDVDGDIDADAKQEAGLARRMRDLNTILDEMFSRDLDDDEQTAKFIQMLRDKGAATSEHPADNADIKDADDAELAKRLDNLNRVLIAMFAQRRQDPRRRRDFLRKLQEADAVDTDGVDTDDADGAEYRMPRPLELLRDALERGVDDPDRDAQILRNARNSLREILGERERDDPDQSTTHPRSDPP